jgi:hypothetical protein
MPVRASNPAGPAECWRRLICYSRVPASCRDSRVLATNPDGAVPQNAPDADTPGEPVAGFKIRELPPASGLAARPGTPNLQPALALGEGGRDVHLYTWNAPAKRWTLQGRMPIPSTAFEWAGLRLGGGARGLRIDVDLGDGVPLPLEVPVVADAIENEYQSSKRFIDDNWEKIDNNYLEEIARKIRTLAAPALQTVANLKAAMEAQN